MPTNTPNLKIPKPLGSEAVSRASLNTIYDTIDANVVALPTDGMARQAIINGNFDVWQRGTSFTGPTDADFYTADRWRVSQSAGGGTLPTVTESRQTLTPGDIAGSFNFARITTNGAGSSLGASSIFIFEQPIEYGTRFLCGNGKNVTVTFWARSSIANKKLAINLSQEYGTGGSPTDQITGSTINLTSTWTKYSFTFTTTSIVGKTFGTNNDDLLRIRIWCMWGSSFNSRLNATAAETFTGSGNIDIAQVQVSAGDVALPFQPRSFGDELALCQRYCYVLTSAGASNSFLKFAVGQASSTTQASIVFSLPEMRVSPSVVTAPVTQFTLSNAAFDSSKQVSAITVGAKTNNRVELSVTCATGLAAGDATVLVANGNKTAFILFDAES